MSKKAFVIVGPESSGNHLLEAILNGRSEVRTPGDSDEVHTNEILLARLDNEWADAEQVVFLRSMPCDKSWWFLPDVWKILRRYNFEPFFIILCREPFAMSCSQVSKHTPESVEHAMDNIQRAYLHIFGQILYIRALEGDCPFYCITYESLILHQNSVIKRLREYTGIECDPQIQAKDMNERWYQE